MTEILAKVLEVEVDRHHAAIKWDQREARGQIDIFAKFKTAFALGVFPSSDNPKSRFLRERHIDVGREFLAAIVVNRVLEKRGNLSKGRLLRDVIDHATGITLAEKDRRRTLYDFNAIYVIHIVGDVAENAVTHERVDRETTHRKAALRRSFITGTTHRIAGIARSRRRVAQQIHQGATIGVVDEFT